MQTTPRGGGPPGGPPSSSAPSRASWLAASDWCEPRPRVLAYACEQYIAAPIWCSVVVADGVGLWLIGAILLRQREQDREARRRRLALSREARLRRSWRALGAAARLASLGAAAGQDGLQRGEWLKSWERVSTARAERKKFLSKRDFNVGGVLSRASGPLLVVFVCCVIGYETHAFYALALPWLGFVGRLDEALRFCMAVIPLRIFLDYARTCLTDPGRPPADGGPGPSREPGDLELGPLRPGVREQQRRCGPCGGPKPARSHHCKVCRRCVLKMDHHCPFVNNCVGLHNHRYFCLFLLDLLLGCLAISGALAPQVPEALMPRRYNLQLTVAHRVHVISAFFIAFMVQATLGPFLLFHVQLILKNETTLEFISRRKRRRGKAVPEGYSRGVLENFAEACGAPPRCCERRLGRVLERLVPQHAARLAKRSA